MRKMYYMVEINSCVESLFDELNEYGFDYEIEKIFCPMDCPDYFEIEIQCYDHEIPDLQEILAPYI